MDKMKPHTKACTRPPLFATFSPEKLRKRGFLKASPVAVGCISSTKILPPIFPINREVEPEGGGISAITT